MLPVLLIMYWRLAKREEREVEADFGEQYRRYVRQVPAFFPRIFQTAGDAA
jgi:protein-S-isoprenylcysteine O-methyltransferase Ste14